MALERQSENGKPTREEIERVYRMAYLLDSNFFKPADSVNFGLDVRQLKEYGAVRMKRQIERLRGQFDGLWRRLSTEQRAAVHMSCILEGMEALESHINELEKQIGDLQDVRDSMTWMNLFLFSRFPKNIVDKLKDAHGKWKASFRD